MMGKKEPNKQGHVQRQRAVSISKQTITTRAIACNAMRYDAMATYKLLLNQCRYKTMIPFLSVIELAFPPPQSRSLEPCLSH